MVTHRSIARNAPRASRLLVGSTTTLAGAIVNKNLLGWIAYAVFAACALGFGWHDDIFAFDRPLVGLKVTVWLAWLAFLAYSVHASRHEDLLRTLRVVRGYYWGRQIGFDLYLGAAAFLVFVYLHEGTALVVLLWLLPVVLFVNLATLLYLAIHFDAIVARFVS